MRSIRWNFTRGQDRYQRGKAVFKTSLHGRINEGGKNRKLYHYIIWQTFAHWLPQYKQGRDKLHKWINMKAYENTQINNLVYPCNMYGYNIKFTDGYGNKTNYLKIDAKQLEQIKNILIN